MSINPVTCVEDGTECSLVKGRDVFPQDASKHAEHYWLCPTCFAYVGCFKAGYGYGDGTRPLGTAANATTRKAREALQQAFNPIWRTTPISRRDAFKAMAKALQIPEDKCRIALFDEATCKAATSWARKYMETR